MHSANEESHYANGDHKREQGMGVACICATRNYLPSFKFSTRHLQEIKRPGNTTKDPKNTERSPSNGTAMLCGAGPEGCPCAVGPREFPAPAAAQLSMRGPEERLRGAHGTGGCIPLPPGSCSGQLAA